MDDQIPLLKARIEWKPNGRFRISHYDDEPCDRSLTKSGGACFARWREVSDRTRESWFLWHAIEAVHEGCAPSQMLDEMNKVSELFDLVQGFMVRPSEVREAKLKRGKEAKDGQAAPE
jgi:hypothetical protein